MKLSKCFVVVTVALLAFAGAAFAEKPLTPDSLEGAKIVTSEDVKKLLDGGATIYDVRKKAEYAEAHIPGAKSLPYKEKSKKVADFDMSKDRWKSDQLPADKAAAVIFQCNGARCWKSYKASVWAIGEGYTSVYWFRGGIPEWKEKGLSVD
jgi:rhodanese-related sulfurtransferase